MNTKMTADGCVYDYQTGVALPGRPSDALAAASAAEHSGTGAVGAYRDADGVWQYLRADEIDAYEDARTVYTR
mgnify:CR=1 FL=1